MALQDPAMSTPPAEACRTLLEVMTCLKGPVKVVKRVKRVWFCRIFSRKSDHMGLLRGEGFFESGFAPKALIGDRGKVPEGCYEIRHFPELLHLRVSGYNTSVIQDEQERSCFFRP